MRWAVLLVFIINLAVVVSGMAQYVRPSNSEQPKNRYADMHGKPWIERLVPGTTFQLQNRGGLDINLFCGYRITARLTTGLGWNERMGFHFRHHFGVSHRRAVYGPRSFVDYKLPWGFSVRGEIETMNTYVPPLLGVSAPGAEGSRRWIWGTFIGVKKNFRLTRWLMPNLQVLYNLHDGVYKTSPYADRLNFRLGFEFLLKKKSKKPVSF